MTSRTVAINRALLKLGVQRVTSEDEESEPARAAKLVFDTACQGELRRHAWSFAKARTSLPADATAPSYGWTYAYTLPPDWLRLLQVGEYYDWPSGRFPVGQRVVPYEIEGRKILTDYGAPLNIRYIKDVTEDPTQWDAAFFEAFCLRLAIEMAPTLVKSEALVARLEKQYSEAIREAKRTNAIELPPEPIPDSDWMSERF